MKKKAFLLFFIVCMLSPLCAFKYCLADIVFYTDGKFSTEVLEKTAAIDTARLFSNLDELDAYLLQIEASLLATRLCNSVDFNYYENTLQVWEKKTDPETGEEQIVIPLYLIVTIEETGNFVIAPYPKFDSNSGFEGKIKIRHNNFLGRMTIFDADAAYIFSTDKKHAVSLGADFSIPFFAGITKNSFYANTITSYNFSDLLFTTDTVAGLLCSLPFSLFSVDIAFEQQYNYDNFSRLNERIIFSVPVQLSIFSFPITITPKISADYAWSTDTLPPYWLFSPYILVHSSQKTWVLNFQKGYDIQTSAGIEYNVLHNTFSPILELTGSVYYPFENSQMASNTAPSHRIHFWYNGSEQKDKGSYIRGILDNEYSGSSGIIVNSDFTISLFQLFVDSLFQNEKLSFLNFELQMAPFIDVSCLFTPTIGVDFTTGLTLIVHPLAMKSIQGRVCFASNPLWQTINKKYTSPYELYIGLGLFY